MLGGRQEVPVAVYSGAGVYSGEVIASATDTDFPFVAVISDETGQVVGEFRVRTQADGEAKIAEVLTDLKKIAAEGGPDAPRT